MKTFTNCVFNYCKKGEVEGTVAYKLYFDFINEDDKEDTKSAVINGEFRYSPLVSTDEDLVLFNVEVDETTVPWTVTKITLVGDETSTDILEAQRKAIEEREKKQIARFAMLRKAIGGNK